MKTLIAIYPIIWWGLGFATCYAYMCYKKQAKGIFNGGEIELVRKVPHYLD